MSGVLHQTISAGSLGQAMEIAVQRASAFFEGLSGGREIEVVWTDAEPEIVSVSGNVVMWSGATKATLKDEA